MRTFRSPCETCGASLRGILQKERNFLIVFDARVT